MIEDQFSKQARDLVNENQRLKVKSKQDDEVKATLKTQYDALAGRVNEMRADYDRQLHIMKTERDKAVRMFTEVDALLLLSADTIMQALRARKGDVTPENIPDRTVLHLEDGRLPAARLS